MSLPVVSEGFIEVFGSSAGIFFKSTENSSKVSSSSDEVYIVSIVSAKSVTPLVLCVTALAVCVTALSVCVTALAVCVAVLAVCVAVLVVCVAVLVVCVAVLVV